MDQPRQMSLLFALPLQDQAKLSWVWWTLTSLPEMRDTIYFILLIHYGPEITNVFFLKYDSFVLRGQKERKTDLGVRNL